MINSNKFKIIQNNSSFFKKKLWDIEKVSYGYSVTQKNINFTEEIMSDFYTEDLAEFGSRERAMGG